MGRRQHLVSSCLMKLGGEGVRQDGCEKFRRSQEPGQAFSSNGVMRSPSCELHKGRELSLWGGGAGSGVVGDTSAHCSGAEGQRQPQGASQEAQCLVAEARVGLLTSLLFPQERGQHRAHPASSRRSSVS